MKLARITSIFNDQLNYSRPIIEILYYLSIYGHTFWDILEIFKIFLYIDLVIHLEDFNFPYVRWRVLINVEK